MNTLQLSQILISLGPIIREDAGQHFEETTKEKQEDDQADKQADEDKNMPGDHELLVVLNNFIVAWIRCDIIIDTYKC